MRDAVMHDDAPRPATPARPSLLPAIPLLFGSPMIALVFTVVAPVLPKIAANFSGGGDAALLAQMIMTAPAIGLMLGGPLCGLLVSRFGARPMYLVFLLAVGLLGGAELLVNNPMVFLLDRALLGFVAAGANNAASTLIAERYEGDLRARLFGLHVAASSVIAVLAVVASGALAQSFGWRAPAVLYFSSLAPAVALVALVRPAPRPDAPEPARQHGPTRIWSSWRFFLLTALTAIPLNLPSVQVSFQLTQDGVTNSLVQSLVIAAFSVTLSIAAPLYPNARRRFGVIGAPLAALLVCGVGFVGAGLAHAPAATALCLLVSGIGAGLLNPHFGIRIAETVDPVSRGTALGVLFGAFFLGEFLSPMVMTPLRLWLGVHGAFSAVGLLLAAISTLMLARGALRRVGAKVA